MFIDLDIRRLPFAIEGCSCHNRFVHEPRKEEVFGSVILDQPRGDDSGLVDVGIAVSYTHLDVYKRQGVNVLKLSDPAL